MSCFHTSRQYAHMSQDDKFWTVSNKILCGNRINLKKTYHMYIFDKSASRMLQQEGILNVLKTFFSWKMSWNHRFKSIKVYHSFVCVLVTYTYEVTSRWVCWLFVKTIWSENKVMRGRKLNLCRTKFDRSCKFILPNNSRKEMFKL